MKRKRTKASQKNQLDILLLKSISSRSYLTVNKDLLKKFGPTPAIFLTNLIDKFLYFMEHDKIKEDGWFFLSHEKQLEQTGIQSEYALRLCKKQFKDLGVIETKWLGQPGKEHYKIHINMMRELGVPAMMKTKGLAMMKTKAHNNNKDNFIYISFEDFSNLFPISWKRDEAFTQSLKDYFFHRHSKNRLTPRAAKGVANKLLKTKRHIATAALTASADNNWDGVFPIKEYGKKYLEEWCREEQEKHRPDKKELNAMLDSESEVKRIKAERWLRIPTPKKLVEQYTKWLNGKEWLKTKSEKLFHPSHKLFDQFITELKNDIGADVITGNKIYGGPN